MTVEQDCLAVLAEELGPAARAFLSRICKNQLKKEPAQLEKWDIEELAKWCSVGTQSTLGAQVAENIKKNLLTLK